jgi:phospholipase C
VIRRLTIGLAVVAALTAVSAAGAASGARARHAPSTPIRHLIVLMQENHTYDNYFGTYKRGDGLPRQTCMPRNLTNAGAGCVKPFAIRNRPVRDLGHTADVFRAQYNDGRMNGFVDAFRRLGVEGSLAMGHYDGQDIPFYWNLADRFVLFDRFFSSAAGGSTWNHMFAVTGTPGNPKVDAVPANGFGNLPLIFDRLQAAGVSWKFYVQNYDPRITYRSRVSTDRGSQIVWVPPLDYARYIDNRALFSHIVDLSQYYKDLNAGKLPEVSYIAPSGSSEHPPGSIQAGERFVRTLLNSLMSSTYWTHSAFIWSYDDWGGWYDHVKPPKVDKFGYGFRVPALLVSPYARAGFTDHTTLDFTSILKFIEQNWNLKPLAARDARANSIRGAFDFSRGPREPAIVAAVRGVKPPAAPQRSIVYPAYVVAFLLTALLIVMASRRSSGSWRRGPGPGGPDGPDGPTPPPPPPPPPRERFRPQPVPSGKPPLPEFPSRRNA